MHESLARYTLPTEWNDLDGFGEQAYSAGTAKAPIYAAVAAVIVVAVGYAFR